MAVMTSLSLPQLISASLSLSFQMRLRATGFAGLIPCGEAFELRASSQSSLVYRRRTLSEYSTRKQQWEKYDYCRDSSSMFGEIGARCFLLGHRILCMRSVGASLVVFAERATRLHLWTVERRIIMAVWGSRELFEVGCRPGSTRQ